MRKQLNDCTHLVSKTLMEHAAYIRACADKKNINLDRYRIDICKEMNKSKRCKDHLEKDKGNMLTHTTFTKYQDLLLNKTNK